MEWQQIVFTLLPIILGIGFIWIRIEKVLRALDEVGDIFEFIPKILEDKNISSEERTQLMKELKEAIEALKAIFKK